MAARSKRKFGWRFAARSIERCFFDVAAIAQRNQKQNILFDVELINDAKIAKF